MRVKLDSMEAFLLCERYSMSRDFDPPEYDEEEEEEEEDEEDE